MCEFQLLLNEVRPKGPNGKDVHKLLNVSCQLAMNPNDIARIFVV